MEKEASASLDRAAKTEETAPGMAYLLAVYAEALRYIYKTEEELVEEYWQAGKLLRKEWPKRCARIARVHPSPKEMEAEIAGYMKYLQEEEEA